MLHINRATFDNYVREGKLPQGEHAIGFKEFSWSLKYINDFKIFKTTNQYGGMVLNG